MKDPQQTADELVEICPICDLEIIDNYERFVLDDEEEAYQICNDCYIVLKADIEKQESIRKLKRIKN